MRWAVLTFVVWITFVGAVIGIGQYLAHRDTVSATRQSNINICQAVNASAHGGITKLVAQLRVQTREGKLTPAQKAQAEVFYAQLEGDFPALDCTQNPIVFQQAATTTTTLP